LEERLRLEFWIRLPDFVAGRHRGRAKSQAHSLVLVLRRIGQLYKELVSFSIECFWLESQLVARMELLQDLS
jgi:hypothetical protein